MTPFDASGVFRPIAAGDGLRRVAVRGAGFTVFGQSLGFIIQMAATVVLARLLAPSDFGLVVMVTTFSLLLVNFGLNGITEAILQREDMNHALASTLFWINAGCGVLLTLAFSSVAPLLARFYGDPRLASVAVVVALTILLTSVSVVHLALLKRAMQFAAVSINDIVARAFSVGISILLAVLGWGYWALVAGVIALPLATCLGAWMLCRWLPGLPRRNTHTVPMIRFALHTYGRFVASYLTWNLDNLLVGWRFGAAPLGYYKKAYDLFILPVNQLSSPLTSVAVSTLSRLTGDIAQYRRYYLNAVTPLAFVGMGVGACLTLVGADVIVLLLGPRWDESGRIFTFFGPGIGIMLVYYTSGWIHLSIGRADRGFRWGLVEVAVTALAFILALPWGPVGIAIAWVTSLWILTVPGLWYAGRPIGLGVAPLIRGVGKYVAASTIAALICAAMMRITPGAFVALTATERFVRILSICAMFGALYLSIVVILHRGLAPIRQILALAADMIPSRRQAAGPPVLSAN
jgi:O-antigen/teichoic acid export membrane protein